MSVLFVTITGRTLRSEMFDSYTMEKVVFGNSTIKATEIGRPETIFTVQGKYIVEWWDEL